MSKLIVGCDGDGVLYNFVQAVADWSGFDPEKATDWDLFAAWGAPGLWPAFDKHAQEKGFCENLKLIRPSRTSWKDDGYTTQEFVGLAAGAFDLVIVTSPYRDAPYWAYEREQALLRDFDIPREKVLSMRSKQYARVDVLIDDKPANLENFPGHRILFDQPWNRNAVGAWTRCCSYKEVLDTVEGMANGE